MSDDLLRRSWRDTLDGADPADLPASRSYRPVQEGVAAPAASGLDLSPGLGEEAHVELPPLDGTPLEELGRGGMGVVYRLPQPDLGREIAIKTLRAKDSPRARAAFVSEALVTAALEHPAIVPVHFLAPGGLAMKLVDGEPWERRLDAGQSLAEALDSLERVMHAVAFAHDRGFLHLDLKPSNVMLGAFDEVLVMDWGLAVSLQPRPGFHYVRTIQRPCGTPAYMAPELARGDGERIGPWTDVYLLGGILFRILTGRPPHRGADVLAATRSCLREARSLSAARAPSELRQICLRALTREPGGRFRSVTAFLEALRGFRAHSDSARLSHGACLRLEVLEAGEAAEPAPYDAIESCLAQLEQAAVLWPENREARSGRAQGMQLLARKALEAGDLALARASVDELEVADGAGTALRAELCAAETRRATAGRRRRRLRRALLASLVGLLGGLGLAVLVRAAKLEDIERERERAELNGGLACDSLADLTRALQTRVLDDHGLQDARRVARGVLAETLEAWRVLAAADDPWTRAQAQLHSAWVSRLAGVPPPDGSLTEALAFFAGASGPEAARWHARGLAERAAWSRQAGHAAPALADLELASARLGAEDTAAPELEAELCLSRAELLLDNDRVDEAVALLAAAEAESARVAEPRRLRAAVLEGRARAAALRGDDAVCLGLVRRRVAELAAWHAEAGTPQRRLALARARLELATLCDQEARGELEGALAELSRLEAAQPYDGPVLASMAEASEQLAGLLLEAGETAAAGRMHGELVSLRRRLVALRGDLAEALALAEALTDSARHLLARGEVRALGPISEELLTLLARAVREDPRALVLACEGERLRAFAALWEGSPDEAWRAAERTRELLGRCDGSTHGVDRVRLQSLRVLTLELALERAAQTPRADSLQTVFVQALDAAALGGSLGPGELDFERALLAIGQRSTEAEDDPAVDDPELLWQVLARAIADQRGQALTEAELGYAEVVRRGERILARGADPFIAGAVAQAWRRLLGLRGPRQGRVAYAKDLRRAAGLQEEFLDWTKARGGPFAEQTDAGLAETVRSHTISLIDLLLLAGRACRALGDAAAEREAVRRAAIALEPLREETDDPALQTLLLTISRTHAWLELLDAAPGAAVRRCEEAREAFEGLLAEPP